MQPSGWSVCTQDWVEEFKPCHQESFSQYLHIPKADDTHSQNFYPSGLLDLYLSQPPLTWCSKLNLNQRPHFGRKKVLVLVTFSTKYLLIPRQGWVRGQNRDRHGVCNACSDHTPVRRQGKKWWRLANMHSHFCTNACSPLWLCTLLPSVQCTEDTNNRTHLLVITAATPDTM